MVKNLKMKELGGGGGTERDEILKAFFYKEKRNLVRERVREKRVRERIEYLYKETNDM